MASARFNSPLGIAVAHSGVVYVSDTYNHAIRKIVANTGETTTLAGVPGIAGNNDGVGSAARFGNPFGLATDESDFVYVADGPSVRRINVVSGEVKTIVGGFINSAALALDGEGHL